MSPVQKEKIKPDLDDFQFKSEFDVEKIQKSAEADIKPKIDFDDKIENAKTVIIKGTYYDFELPNEKQINKEKVKALNMLYNGVEHYFIAEAESFRFQIDVIRFRKKLTVEQIDGLKLKIWTEIQNINTPKFKGKAKVYCLKEVK